MDKELTEKQFEMIKQLCHGNAAVIFSPDRREDDDEEVINEITEVKETLNALVDAGLLRNVTKECTSYIAESKRQGGRGFEAFMVEKTAYEMFFPPKGRVN